jgi:electron transfer flavoprotein alpha/beta subunit
VSNPKRSPLPSRAMTEPYTIVVTYANGTTSTFHGCTGVTETETKLVFTGKKEGEAGTRQWTIMLSNVLEWGRSKG